ncbi:MAG: VanZ family protein [Clostridia bacterium]|nr:VanZ family protein [Clostridia bacterium]
MKKKFTISKINVIRAILFALIIAVMAVIFALSAQNSAESSGTSGGVTELLLSLFGIGKGNMSEAEFTKLEGFIRSAAHFSGFAVLAFFVCLLLSTYKFTGARKLAFSVIFTSFYAITDEVHQFFVPGRACELSDWLVDTAGALTGAAAVLLIIFIKKKIKEKKSKA